MSGDQLAARQEPPLLPLSTWPRSSRRYPISQCPRLTNIFRPALVIQTLSHPVPHKLRRLPYFPVPCLKHQRITRVALPSQAAGHPVSPRSTPFSTLRRET